MEKADLRRPLFLFGFSDLELHVREQVELQIDGPVAIYKANTAAVPVGFSLVLLVRQYHIDLFPLCHVCTLL